MYFQTSKPFQTAFNNKNKLRKIKKVHERKLHPLDTAINMRKKIERKMFCCKEIKAGRKQQKKLWRWRQQPKKNVLAPSSLESFAWKKRDTNIEDGKERFEKHSFIVIYLIVFSLFSKNFFFFLYAVHSFHGTKRNFFFVHQT